MRKMSCFQRQKTWLPEPYPLRIVAFELPSSRPAVLGNGCRGGAQVVDDLSNPLVIRGECRLRVSVSL
jgi:hypothetical protein